tara:strand:+ start:43 stop:564 length:522 start_codon:yes stop_codon:yes gene_type:complete
MDFSDPAVRAAYQKQYRQKHKEKIREKAKEYYENNKEKKSAYNAEYREKNKVQLKEKAKEFYEKNREEIIDKTRAYQAEHREEIAERYKEYCQTEKGIKSYRIRNWKSQGVISEDYNVMYDYYINCKNCEKCNVVLTFDKNKSTRRCLTHNHKTGQFQNVLCQGCSRKKKTIN